MSVGFSMKTRKVTRQKNAWLLILRYAYNLQPTVMTSLAKYPITNPIAQLSNKTIHIFWYFFYILHSIPTQKKCGGKTNRHTHKRLHKKKTASAKKTSHLIISKKTKSLRENKNKIISAQVIFAYRSTCKNCGKALIKAFCFSLYKA